MNDGIIAFCTAFFNYCCMVVFGHYVFEYTARKISLTISLSVFIPLFVMANVIDSSFVTPILGAFMILQFVLIKIIFPDAKIRKFILFYVFLYGVNLIFTSAILSLVYRNHRYIELLISFVFSVSCILICMSKSRYYIKQILFLTPKYVLIIAAILLLIATITSVLISAFQMFDFPDVWNRFVRIFVSFLLLAICTVVPVIFVISISNTRLKSLTADYEQQIRAQAEHYKELAEANYETRRFRHDFNNMRIALEQLYADGEYERAMELLSRCSAGINACKPQFDTGNGIADALLTDKQTKAEKQGSSIVFDGMLTPDAPEPTDLCVILGNTLDNAIEACEKLPAQQDKTITVSGSCCGGFLFLTVKNPINIPVSIKGGRIATTKDNKTLHGFGLYSLNAVVRKYDGTVKLSADDQTFTAEIELSLHPSAPKQFSLLP